MLVEFQQREFRGRFGTNHIPAINRRIAHDSGRAIRELRQG